jgi:hypothetical protein
VRVVSVPQRDDAEQTDDGGTVRRRRVVRQLRQERDDVVACQRVPWW